MTYGLDAGRPYPSTATPAVCGRSAVAATRNGQSHFQLNHGTSIRVGSRECLNNNETCTARPFPGPDSSWRLAALLTHSDITRSKESRPFRTGATHFAGHNAALKRACRARRRDTELMVTIRSDLSGRRVRHCWPAVCRDEDSHPPWASQTQH